MILYHGSTQPVEKPDISFSRDALDFGKGFYTTTMREQAAIWAKRFERSNQKGILSVYEVDESALRNTVSVLEFSEHNEDWLRFILANRFERYEGKIYDVVIGGMADDNVFNALQMFVDGYYDTVETIRRLSFFKPNIQYCFRSQPIIDRFIKFVSSEEI